MKIGLAAAATLDRRADPLDDVHRLEPRRLQGLPAKGDREQRLAVDDGTGHQGQVAVAFAKRITQVLQTLGIEVELLHEHLHPFRVRLGF